MSALDRAVLDALELDAFSTKVSAHGGSGFASTYKIQARINGEDTRTFFMKTGRGEDARVMFEGEHASLNAINDVEPTLCPRALAHGALADKAGYFLVTEFLHMGGSSSSSSTRSLAAKLANLHTAPAPSAEFGFPVTTCCGATPQPNTFRTSWAEFYAENRLRFILLQNERVNGRDAELRTAIERTADVVVPRLLGHLQDVVPVVVHGDLWSGNKGRGRIGNTETAEEVVFDPSCCYGHAEYDLGIMKMFGGFGSAFFNEYHQICPKTKPEEEYEDRVELYELYHHLNHNALFGGSYRSGAMSIMKNLWRKYGTEG
ncbi:fructosamine kinase [Auricularia subglabra TFB-10046 SS5]|nr:fructosamine kinase [Auricularia subglabra TFB-10046 SS5]